jgi:hypothetical protein
MRTLFLLALVGCGDRSLSFINTDPNVVILSPTDGEGLIEDAPVVLRASVEDAESRLEDIALEWSTDRGVLVGEPGVVEGDVTLSVTGFPSGPLTLTLTAIDANGASTTDSVDVTVAINNAPELTFTEPADNAQLVFGNPVTIGILASDDRDEAEDLALDWSLGVGPGSPNADGSASVVLTDLAVGAHDVRVTVTDTLGVETQATLALFVTDGDVDEDGFASIALGGTDCDDGDADVFPGADELCNGIDDNCNSTTDESNPTAPQWYLDDDGDTFGAGDAVRAGAAAENYVADNTDCDDTPSAVNPDATEVCNSRDDNCDTVTDSDAADRTPFYADSDSDGFGAGTSTLSCSPPASTVTNNTDCDDTRSAVNPDATEVCNDLDDNCDSITDTDATDRTLFYRDADRDSFGNVDQTQLACTLPAGFVTNPGDCNDNAAGINPNANELCGGADEDCDGVLDTGATNTTLYYRDADTDGYGTPGDTERGCNAPSGYVSNADDCNDSDRLIHPFIDTDNDGSNACLDCDDTASDRTPGASEQCDGVDNDCDGTVPADETNNADADAFVTCADCDDTDPLVFPGADERCNAVDDNCDGEADETSCPCPVFADDTSVPYQFCEGSLNWGQAIDACGDDYGLVSIESANENTFLREVIEDYPWSTPPTGQTADDAWWTSGSRPTGNSGQFCANGSSAWEWLGGSALTYTNWRAGEPNSLSGCEGCVEIWLDDATGQPRAEWNDENCGQRRNYICEPL